MLRTHTKPTQNAHLIQIPLPLRGLAKQIGTTTIKLNCTCLLGAPPPNSTCLAPTWLIHIQLIVVWPPGLVRRAAFSFSKAHNRREHRNKNTCCRHSRLLNCSTIALTEKIAPCTQQPCARQHRLLMAFQIGQKISGARN